MAKKHTINDIQKALLSNTRYIKEEETIVKVEKPKIEESKPTQQEVNIDPLLMKQLRILAPYLGETTDDLINKALGHFLRLKKLQLDQAIEKLTEE